MYFLANGPTGGVEKIRCIKDIRETCFNWSLMTSKLFVEGTKTVLGAVELENILRRGFLNRWPGVHLYRVNEDRTTIEVFSETSDPGTCDICGRTRGDEIGQCFNRASADCYRKALGKAQERIRELEETIRDAQHELGMVFRGDPG